MAGDKFDEFGIVEFLDSTHAPLLEIEKKLKDPQNQESINMAEVLGLVTMATIAQHDALITVIEEIRADRSARGGD